MTDISNTASTTMAASRARPAAAEAGPAPENDFGATLEEILDGGFSAFAEKTLVEKMIKFRNQILDGLGLSLEDLPKLQVEQRQMIEQAVAHEMQQQIGDGKSGDTGAVSGVAVAKATTERMNVFLQGQSAMALLLQSVDGTEPSKDPAA